MNANANAKTKADRYTVALGNERHGDVYYTLTDSVTGIVVFDDGGEVEDKLLVRDMRPLVVELNRLAAIVAAQTEALAVAADAVRGLPGCPMPDCYGCKRNKETTKRIAYALKLGAGEVRS